MVGGHVSLGRRSFNGGKETPVASVRSLLRDRVVLQVRFVDRLFLRA